jgi:ABC-type molybdate transport system substrate-binding protein
VDQIIADFQQREDVSVNTIYDGCGVLTSRMKTIDGQSQKKGFPDVYMACDVYYLENVKQWFQEAANVSDTEIIIAVPKGSTKVRVLADLLEPGVRVAVGEPDQCTIGALTRRLLVKEGIYDRLKEKQRQDGEVVVEKSSSAHLVPDVVTGHVDAAVAYITDVLANRDSVDIVRIDSPMNVAIQPFSIAKTSDHKYLVRRLFRKIADSPEAFENIGFHFRLNLDAGEEKSEATGS